jgi:hypothetical protein
MSKSRTIVPLIESAYKELNLNVMARGDWRWLKKARPVAKQSRAAPDADTLGIEPFATALETHDLKPAFNLDPGEYDRTWWQAHTTEYLAFYAANWKTKVCLVCQPLGQWQPISFAPACRA